MTPSRQANFRWFRVRFEETGKKEAHSAILEVHSVLLQKFTISNQEAARAHTLEEHMFPRSLYAAFFARLLLKWPLVAASVMLIFLPQEHQ